MPSACCDRKWPDSAVAHPNAKRSAAHAPGRRSDAHDVGGEVAGIRRALLIGDVVGARAVVAARAAVLALLAADEAKVCGDDGRAWVGVLAAACAAAFGARHGGNRGTSVDNEREALRRRADGHLCEK